MKRSVLTLVLGVVVGTTAHLAYFRLHQPAATDSLDRQLAWIKAELQLTDAQFTRIKELHHASTPRLRALTGQLARLQAEFTEFERARRTADRVDFLEFARFVETRRQVSRQCRDSTRELMLAAAEVMTPEQRQHYISLVTSAEPFARTLLN